MGELLLEARELRMSFGSQTVLDVEAFSLYDGDRIGLVGENGAGKSTLLRVLAGELAPESGRVQALREVQIIRQMGDSDAGEEEDDALRARLRAPEERENLSGGERTRRRIVTALSRRGAILLADEPTTDLDAQGRAQMQKLLADYRGALVLVSHDRALLDALCTAIAELKDGRLTLYPGNYAAYEAERQRRREFAQFEYEQYRAEQARLRAAIQGEVEHASQVGKLPGRMGNSEARLHRRSATEIEEKLHKSRKALQTRLEQLEQKQRPATDPSIRMRFGQDVPVTSRTALEMRAMSIRFGARTLLQDAALRVPTGSRTALLGENGCGKSTLLARIASGRDPRVRISPGVRVGFFGQDVTRAIDEEKTALQNALEDSAHDEGAARAVLARLNLRGDAVFKRAGVLSGGERVKVMLARLMLSRANLLILDEPTNHIDVFTMEALESVLAEYGGTLLFVSHDPRFVQTVATRLVFFENQTLRSFEGDWSAWEEARAQAAQQARRQAQLELTTLQMRMAELLERISRPRRGDVKEQLEEAYAELAQRVRALREEQEAEKGE